MISLNRKWIGGVVLGEIIDWGNLVKYAKWRGLVIEQVEVQLL